MKSTGRPSIEQFVTCKHRKFAERSVVNKDVNNYNAVVSEKS